MRNIEVAWIFHEMADLLEFKGESFFKTRAYKNAARILSGLDEPVEKYWASGELVKIPGIGKNISSKVGEILATGGLKKHSELLEEIPPGLLEVMSLPGIGPGKARILYQGLGITGLGELVEAARRGRVRGLPGMGNKTESDIIRNVEMLEERHGRVLLATARELAEELMAYLKDLPGVLRVETAGSLRRWRETVGDIDLVASSDRLELLIEALAGHPRVRELVDRNNERVRFQTNWGINVDLEVMPEDRFVMSLFLNTGSQAHLKRLMELIKDSASLLGNNRFSKDMVIHDERGIYAALGLPFIPPELREDRGEVEAALQGKIPNLVQLADIKGDLHLHSSWSDGLNSLEQLVARARARGYRYIAVTDHSQSLKVARGLSLDRLKEQHQAIRELNEQMDDFRVLTGIEVDILAGGVLDCPEEILEQSDLVVASVHTGFKQNRETMTARLIAAAENRHVDIIGHLTGRLLTQREGYQLDIERVFEAAARCGTILEINASPDRLDLNDINARRAVKDYGIKVAINTDAHDLRRMEEMRYGVSVARRAWLEPEDVVNTMDIEELLEHLQARSN